MASGDGLLRMKRTYSTTALSSQIPEHHSENFYNRDEAEIARFGKKQQLRVCPTTLTCFPTLLLYQLTDRSPAKIWPCVYNRAYLHLDDYMGGISDVSLNFSTNVGCLDQIKLKDSFSVFQNGLNNGGPAGLVYGFLVTWVGNGLQALVMAEMASMLVIMIVMILHNLLTKQGPARRWPIQLVSRILTEAGLKDHMLSALSGLQSSLLSGAQSS